MSPGGCWAWALSTPLVRALSGDETHTLLPPCRAATLPSHRRPGRASAQSQRLLSGPTVLSSWTIRHPLSRSRDLSPPPHSSLLICSPCLFTSWTSPSPLVKNPLPLSHQGSPIVQYYTTHKYSYFSELVARLPGLAYLVDEDE